MVQDSSVAAIAHVIELAVAPVFLVTGVGALLAVLTNRLARIIDRARVLEERLGVLGDSERAADEADLRTLSRRARYINRAISLSVTCALLVCAVIAALFGGTFVEVDLSGLVGMIFIAAMFALIGALVSFLREIYIATRSLRIGQGQRG
ncbi:MAG TPA: DUF2721 domain-containing protein [Gemmatimonadales bacterium]|nr:DUF2721 domain-containing protein [Gemmatimonadales bacterium]